MTFEQYNNTLLKHDGYRLNSIFSDHERPHWLQYDGHRNVIRSSAMNQDVTQTKTTFCHTAITKSIDPLSLTWYCLFVIKIYTSTSLPRVLNCITNDRLIFDQVTVSIRSIMYGILNVMHAVNKRIRLNANLSNASKCPVICTLENLSHIYHQM